MRTAATLMIAMVGAPVTGRPLLALGLVVAVGATLSAVLGAVLGAAGDGDAIGLGDGDGLGQVPFSVTLFEVDSGEPLPHLILMLSVALLPGAPVTFWVPVTEPFAGIWVCAAMPSTGGVISVIVAVFELFVFVMVHVTFQLWVAASWQSAFAEIVASQALAGEAMDRTTSTPTAAAASRENRRREGGERRFTRTPEGMVGVCLDVGRTPTASAWFTASPTSKAGVLTPAS